jgi:hypothetical protein
MNRLTNLRNRAAKFLSWCFHPVLLLLAALGTNCFRVRAFFMSRDHARASALRLDFHAANLGVEKPVQSCASYQRAVIAAKRTRDPALLLQTLTYAADHYFLCQRNRAARRAARRALVLAAARCGQPLKNDSRHFEDETMQSLTSLIRQCDWLIRGTEARSYEQSAESCLAEQKYMHAATMFRVAAESASSSLGGDALPVGLLLGRQGDALLEHRRFKKAARVLQAANNIVCEWLEPGNPQRKKISDNLTFAVRSVAATEEEEEERQADHSDDGGQYGWGGIWPYGA